MVKSKILTIKDKLIILFIDYMLFGITFLITEDIFWSIPGLERQYPWLFRLFIFLIYFVFTEFYFGKTLGMKIFKVSINQNSYKSNIAFFKYSIIALFDRTIFIVLIYIFRVLFYSKNHLLISEKYSGLRWTKT
tara:strand:- start:2441 stop:2842 length:402 start_codon:yes stop_codon:yes gene_type:complete